MPVCNHCDRSFVDKNALRMHTESKHEIECTYCDRTFRTSDGRDQHERTKHKFPCNTCNREFSSRESLDQHEEAKHKFHCNICNREFGSRESLDQHEEAKHKFHCNICNRELTSVGALIQHQNAKHAPRPHASSYLFSLPPYVQAATPAPVEQPNVNVLDALSTRESTPDGEDVLMTQPPKVQVTAPKSVANFACGTCGEPFATILAMDAHESQHRPDTCACPICERADRPCNCIICKRTSTLTGLVNEEPLDRVMSGESEETTLSADSLGGIEPKAVEDSLVGSCDLVMTPESQGVTDPSVDCSVPAHDMDSRDKQPLPEPEREVYGEYSHDLTPAHAPLPPRHKHNNLDDPTCLSEVTMNLSEECSITNLQLGFAPMECDTIPCDLNVLEQHSALNAHAIVQDPIVYELMRPSQPDVSLDLTNSQSQDHDMSLPEASDEQPIVLDMDMSHEQVDNPPECDPCIPGLEPDLTSSSHSTDSPADGTLVLATSIPVPIRSPQFIGSPQVCTSDFEPPAELGDPFTRNLVPSPTPSEHGSFRPPSITQDDHSHSGSRPLLSPLTSEGSAGYFSDADRSSTPSSPLSDHSVVFVSADSIPEYVRENRAYLVATSAPSRPSSATSSCVHLPSVVTSSDSLPLQQDQNDRAEVPPADLPSTNGQSHLYCRVCLRDPCDDLTATMCGHVFCNRCIIDAVMARSACPVCTAPTLLYCLFRLDI
ncbi:hypothetical protein F4604DRAFT_911311 [Suillus subluteus]|nr:hypothetical protein F4604DRAFT_911311 [Suillus subluteus]